LIAAGLVGVILALLIPSVIELWYTIGSLFIPSLIFLIVGSYYEKFEISRRIAIVEMITAIIVGMLWMILRDNELLASSFYEIEPMIVGLISAFLIHMVGMQRRGRHKSAP
jgi:SSS family solute:Na+ symporter